MTITIRDPVHGDIEISPEEALVLDTPEVQRLRGVRQLGTAYLVYPGCLHTRFDHSLGTCHMARRIIDQLRRSGHTVTSDEERLARLAALVHDVTHAPFGHTIEDERRILARHDVPERFEAAISQGGLGRALAALGAQQEVLAILTGIPQPSAPLGSSRPWLRQLVAGSLDADLLDYLRRDAYFAGLSQVYDDRILSALTLAEMAGGTLAVRAARHGLTRSDVRSEVLHLLRMRYFLTERVYTHHTKLASGAMVSQAAEMAMARGELSDESLRQMTDEQLLRALALSADPDARSLAEGVLVRRIHRRAYVLQRAAVGPAIERELVGSYGNGGPTRHWLAERLAEKAGLSPGQILIHCPPASQFKEVAVPMVTPDGVVPLTDVPETKAEVEALREQYANLWQFAIFSPRENAEAVGRAAERLLGHPNAFRPERSSSSRPNG